MEAQFPSATESHSARPPHAETLPRKIASPAKDARSIYQLEQHWPGPQTSSAPLRDPTEPAPSNRSWGRCDPRKRACPNSAPLHESFPRRCPPRAPIQTTTLASCSIVSCSIVSCSILLRWLLLTLDGRSKKWLSPSAQVFSLDNPNRPARDSIVPPQARGWRFRFRKLLESSMSHVPPHPPLRRRLRTLQPLRPIHPPPRSQRHLPLRLAAKRSSCRHPNRPHHQPHRSGYGLRSEEH